MFYVRTEYRATTGHIRNASAQKAHVINFCFGVSLVRPYGLSLSICDNDLLYLTGKKHGRTS